MFNWIVLNSRVNPENNIIAMKCKSKLVRLVIMFHTIDSFICIEWSLLFLSFENFFIWIIHRTFIWPLATTSFDEDCFKNNVEQVLFRQSAESRDCCKNNFFKVKIHSWNFQHFVTYHKVLWNLIVRSFNSLWTSSIPPICRVSRML